MTNPVALIDMDGTIADYDRAMKEALDELRSPGEPVYTSFSGKNEPWIEARRKLVSRVPGFWKNLPVHEAGFDVIRVLRALGYDLMVLTKGPTTKPAAWGEKVEWCRKHLPDNTPVTITEDKSLVYGRILVDDWPEYFEPWLHYRPRGVVICPAHPWNVDAETRHPNHVWRYDRDAPDAKITLLRVLKAVRDRKDGESVDLISLLSEKGP
jgi:5'-nucleotidase